MVTQVEVLLTAAEREEKFDDWSTEVVLRCRRSADPVVRRRRGGVRGEM